MIKRAALLGLLLAVVEAYPPYYSTLNTGGYTVAYPSLLRTAYKTGLEVQGRTLEEDNVDVLDTEEQKEQSPLVLISPQTLVSGLFIKPVFVTLPSDLSVNAPAQVVPGLPLVGSEPQRSSFQGLVPNIPEAVQPGAIHE